MAEVNLRSWSEISQASEGLQLNSTAATLEHILARFARLETRLVEHERRVAATLPPLQPEPDPPDGPLLYTAAQPPYPPYQPPYQPDRYPPHNRPGSTTALGPQPDPSSRWCTPHRREQPGYQHYFHNQPTPSDDYHQSLQQTYQQLPLTSAATATSLLHQNHQPQPPNAHQPPRPYSHQPPPPPNTHQPPTLPYVPPRQTTVDPTAPNLTQTQPRQQLPWPNSCWYPPTQQLHTPPQYPSYIGGPDPTPPYGASTHGLPGAQPQKQAPIQPATGCFPLTGHQCSAAPRPAVAVQPYRGCPMDTVVVPHDAIVEEVQDKSCSEVMLFNRKSYDGDEMLMVAQPPLAAISLPSSPYVSGEEGALFEDEAPLPAGIPPPCSPNQVSVDEDEVLPHHKDYSDHTSVPIESVDSMEFEHLGEGNDRIEVNGENKDRDRVDEKESLVLGAEGKRTDAFLDVDIIGDFMAPNEVYMEPNEVYNGTGQSCIFDPGGHIYQSFDRDWKRSEAIIGTSIIIQIRCHTTVGYWRTKQRSYVFDPGEDISPKLLLSTLFIVSWFPP